jgi:hypothetical protein
MMDRIMLISFIRESNAIEGIIRKPTTAEIEATEAFVNLPSVAIEHLISLVKVYQPDAVLRDKEGLNVRVGNHYPPYGGPNIVPSLQKILDHAHKPLPEPWHVHVEYETLHPFTDGNGRSGRALWLWIMQDAPIGFLHKFYYQTLQNTRVL